jgi:hypothetical protein
MERELGKHYPAERGLTMESTGLIAFLFIGAIAGWLAGALMKGGGFGL